MEEIEESALFLEHQDKFNSMPDPLNSFSDEPIPQNISFVKELKTTYGLQNSEENQFDLAVENDEQTLIEEKVDEQQEDIIVAVNSSNMQKDNPQSNEWDPLLNIKKYCLILEHRLLAYENAFQLAYRLQVEHTGSSFDVNQAGKIENFKKSYPKIVDQEYLQDGSKIFDNVATTLSEMSSNLQVSKISKGHSLGRYQSTMSEDTSSGGEEDLFKGLSSLGDSSSKDPDIMSLDQIAAARTQMRRRNALVEITDEDLIDESKMQAARLDAALKQLYLERTARTFDPGQNMPKSFANSIDFYVKATHFEYIKARQKSKFAKKEFCMSFLEMVKERQNRIFNKYLRNFPSSSISRQAFHVIGKLKKKQFNGIIKEGDLIVSFTNYQISRLYAVQWLVRLNRYRKERTRWLNIADLWRMSEEDNYYIRLTLPIDLQEEPSDESPFQIENWRFRRLVFLNLHPNQDFELDLPFFIKGLQHINSSLFVEDAFFYFNHILKLPCRPRLNLKMFAILAALSERNNGIEEITKYMKSNTSIQALDRKIKCAIEIFKLLNGLDRSEEIMETLMTHSMVREESLNEDLMPFDHLKVNRFIEKFKEIKTDEDVDKLEFLEAKSAQLGGMIPQKIFLVACEAARLNKLTGMKLCKVFDVTQNGVITFLDFLLYFPFFYHLHKRIISDSLCEYNSNLGTSIPYFY